MSFCFHELEESLKTELRIRNFTELFESYSSLIDPDNQLSTPDELLIYLHDLTQPSDRKDRIVTKLFGLYGKSGNSVWVVFLMLVFLPMLGNLYWTKRNYADFANSDDFIQDIVVCFLRSVQNVDTEQRDTGLAGKVKNATRKSLFDLYESHWQYGGTFVSSEDRLSEYTPNNNSLNDENRMDRLIDLSTCLQAGVISERDYQLIVSCEIEGYSIRELAELESIAYEALKKRRTRAIQAIRRYLGKEYL